MIQKSVDTHRVALFAGSFDPFTRGHLDILRRGLRLFDRVVVCVGFNASKTPPGSCELLGRVDSIKRVVGCDERVDVVSHGGLTVDAARRYGASALLRGVRSVSDFDYECRMADINRRLTGVDTVLLLADPQWASVSSSVVRELMSYGADVSQYLPDDDELQK